MAQSTTTGSSRVAGTNVLFKRGLENNLFNLKTYEDGCFYLTSDTNRLYIGVLTEDNSVKLESVNEGVQTVETIANLPNIKTSLDHVKYQGRFYYVSNDNILVVCSGTEWVQINPDTTLYSNDITTENLSNGVKVTSTIQDTSGNDAKIASFNIIKDGDLSITRNESGDIVISYQAPEESAVQMTNAYTKESQTLKGNITISTTQGGVNVGSINLKAGDNLQIDKDSSADTYLISADNMYVSGFQAKNNEIAGFDFKIEDAQTELSGEPLQANIDPVIKLNATDTGTHFVNGVATLSTYSQEEIGNLIIDAKRDMNSMTYKGIINNSSELEKIINGTTPASIGDTYKIAAPFEYNKISYHTGDLIICNIKDGEEAEGIIPLGQCTVDLIPSGNDYIYVGSHTSESNSHTIKLQSQLEGVLTEEPELSLTLKADTVLSLTTANETDVTISHNTPAQSEYVNDPDISQEELTNASYTAITGIDYDNYGHIKGYKTGKFTVTDTHVQLNSLTTAVTAAKDLNSLDIVTTLFNDDADLSGNKISLTSKNLSFDATTNIDTKNVEIEMNLTWGSF